MGSPEIKRFIAAGSQEDNMHKLQPACFNLAFKMPAEGLRTPRDSAKVKEAEKKGCICEQRTFRPRCSEPSLQRLK